MRGAFPAAAVAVLLVMGWLGTADAALPPSELMEARLKQSREARAPVTASVVVTVTDERVRDFTGTVKLVSNGSFELKSADGKKFTVGASSKDPAGRLIGWVLMSSDPVDALGEHGEFEPKKTAVEVIDDIFGYRYGASPALVMKRSLDQILELRWNEGGVAWIARFEHGDEAWPRTVSVTRGGKPFLRMEIDPQA